MRAILGEYTKETLPAATLLQAKKSGFSDRQVNRSVYFYLYLVYLYLSISTQGDAPRRHAAAGQTVGIRGPLGE